MKFKEYDVVSVGDCGIDTFMVINDAHVLCSINKQSCQFCVNYADKIAVEKCVQTTAGNSCNNAVASARLGLKDVFYTSVGGDPDGKKITDMLKKEGVDTSLVRVFPKMESNKTAALVFHAERTLFVYHQPWKYSLPKLPKAKWVYYSSMGHGFEVLHEPLLEYLKKSGAKLAFNPGTHQRKGAYANIKKMVEATHTFFFNKEEAAELLKVPYTTPFKKLLKGIRDLGPEIAVITDGPNGSTTYDGEEFRQIGIYNTPIVERTGVGDSYASGFIAAEIYGKNVWERMQWGTLNSSGVVTAIGPQEGLRTKADIEKIMRSKPKFTKAKFW